VNHESDPIIFTMRRVLALLCCVSPLGLAPIARADEVGTALYVRTDSDKTTVVSPRVRGKLHVQEETSVEVIYTVDVWSSASIDIRTAASKMVVEQRDEIDANVAHELEDMTLTAGYRYSKENDYVSNGGSTSLALDFADNAATLSASLFFGVDVVGRAGDADFERGLDTLGGRIAFLQVLDTETLLQVSYDLTNASGFQASPYRYVGLGGNGLCTRPDDELPLLEPLAVLCVPERVPDARLRHAIVGLGKRALSDAFSVGLSYRFYFDSWSLSSHTIDASLALLVAEPTSLALRYRFYTQGAVSFYRARYEITDAMNDGLTSDRELSAMGSHRIALELVHEVPFDDGTILGTAITGGLTFYHYDEFPRLKSVTATEITAALAVHL
jgi:hypothetical protein